MREFNCKIDDIIINYKATLGDAILNLNRSGSKIVLLIDSENRLLGTITDGDIRRALLKGFTLRDESHKVANLKPIKVKSTKSKKDVKKLMEKNKIQHIPVVDDLERIIGIHIWDHSFSLSSLENTLVIMAGGRGSRLGSATEKLPKPMIKIGGKPILEHIILNAKNDGIRRILISINYLGEVIKNYFKNGESFGVEIGYLEENQPLGTAGALSLIEKIPSQELIVMNGDLITDIDYNRLLEFHRLYEASATMAVRLNEIKNSFGVVYTDGLNITGYEEKPISRNMVNAGIYVLNEEVIESLQPHTYIDMPELLETARKKGLKTIAFPIHENWIDIVKPEDLNFAITNWGGK